MFQTSSKCYDRAVLLWSRPIVLATTLPNKEGSWVLGLQGSVAKILQNPVQRCHHVPCWNTTVYRGVLTSGCWNRGVPLYTEESSLQGVGIEGFHCIQRCPHFRVLE